MRPIRILSFRTEADASYSLSALRGYNSVLNSLRRSIDIKEIWIVENGGSFAKRYEDEIDAYNTFSFTDANDIMEKLNPDLVISSAGDYEYLHRSMLKAAAHKGIPTVDFFYSAFGASILDDGYDKKKILGRVRALRKHASRIIRRYIFLLKTLYRADYGVIYIGLTMIRDSYLPFVSWLPRYRFGGGDLNIISTPEWAEVALKNGIDKNKIVITGDISTDAIYDRLMNLKSKSKTTNRGNKIEILFITVSMVEHGYWNASMQEEVVTTVVKSIKEKLGEDANLRLKIHPTGERVEIYKQLIKPIDPSIEIIQNTELLPLINESDVVISFGNSSALFEVLLLEKPLYVMNIFNEDPVKNLFLKERVAIECKSGEELVKNIKSGSYKKVESDDLNAFLKKCVYKFDGKCSERAANYIISFLNHRLNLSKSSQ